MKEPKFERGDRVVWSVPCYAPEDFPWRVPATVTRVLPLRAPSEATPNPVQLYDIRADFSIMRRRRFAYLAREAELTREDA